MSSRSTHLRLVPAPQPDPPYDDEGPPAPPPNPPAIGGFGGGYVQGTLALALPATASAPPRPRLRAVRPYEAADRPAPDPAPPPAARWARTFVQVLLEVLCERRPSQQLVRSTSTEVYEQLRRLTSRPLRVQRPPFPRSVRSFEPRPGVAEVSCVVQVGARRHAIALRLEARGERWQCTALELGPISPRDCRYDLPRGRVPRGAVRPGGGDRRDSA